MIKSLLFVPIAISGLLLASCSTGSMASKQDSMAATKMNCPKCGKMGCQKCGKVACPKCGKMGCTTCMKADKMMGKQDAMMDKKAAAKIRKDTIMGN